MREYQSCECINVVSMKEEWLVSAQKACKRIQFILLFIWEGQCRLMNITGKTWQCKQARVQPQVNVHLLSLSDVPYKHNAVYLSTKIQAMHV